MAIVFLVFSLALITAYVGWRKVAMSLIVLGIVLSLAIFNFHATDILKINL